VIVPVSRRRDVARLRRLGVRRSSPSLALTAVSATAWADADPDRPDDHHPAISPTDDALHVAFAIPSALGRAVARNRARRRLRAALAQLEAEGRIEPGWYLIACRRLSPPLPFQELVEELARLTSSAVAPSQPHSAG